MKRIFLSLVFVFAFSSFLTAQEIEGSYINGADKFVFIKSGSHYIFEAFDKNVKYSEGFAYYSSEYKLIVIIFQRTDNQSTGYGNFKFEGSRISGKTLNPDLSKRWEGTFTRE